MSDPSTSTPGWAQRLAKLALFGLGAVPLLLLVSLHLTGSRDLVATQDQLHASFELQYHLAGLPLLIDGPERAEPATIRAELESCRRLLDSIHQSRSDPMETRAAALDRRLSWLSTLVQRQLEQRDPVGQELPRTPQADELRLVYRAMIDEVALWHAELAEQQREQRHRLLRWMAGTLAGSSVLLALALFAVTRHRRSGRDRHLRFEAASLRDRLHSQKMEAVGRLAGGIAHDLNNYLAAVTAHCELVRMAEAEGSEVAGKMDSVLSTAGKASKLLQRLVDFSRQKPARFAIVELNRVVEGVVPMLRRLLGEDVELELGLQPEAGRVEIDPSQVEQVLVNLVVNAREAMPTGGTIRITTERSTGRIQQSSQERELAILTVADDGPGIPESVRERIFEPYYSTKASSGSSGLGLATVYGIASQNGGDVELETEVGKGSLFRVRWPHTDRPATPGTTVRRVVRETTGRERILLVEDSDELRSATEEMLTRLGYRVASVPDAETALELFDDDPGAFDLLMTDIVLGGMSGPELATAVREREPEFAVLFVSGYRDSVVFRHAGLEEIDFLPKPFSAASLQTRIREALSR